VEVDRVRKFEHRCRCCWLCAVPGGAYSSVAEVESGREWQSGRHSGGVLGSHPGVPDGRGVGVGGKCEQGSEGETHHSAASATGHPGRRGVGHADQGDDRGRRRDPAHPQVPDQQDHEEGLRDERVEQPQQQQSGATHGGERCGDASRGGGTGRKEGVH
jgi:hypothetical protein